MTTANTAVIPESLDHEELMALLGQAGMINKGGDSTFRRMSLKNGVLITDEGKPNEESWPPTKRGPVMTVRIAKPPIYYNSFYCDEKEENGSIDARKIGRPDLNGKFVKKYDDPSEQANDDFSNLDAYEELCRVTGNRGSFKADIQLQIVPESGEMNGDEPIYTLSLSTTSALDWRGSSKNPSGGTVQEKNFIVQLAELAQSQVEGESKTAQAQAVLNAMTALRLGGVVAEVRLIGASNKEKTRNWTVVAFSPIHIESVEEAPALTEGKTEPEGDVLEGVEDDIPF